MRIVKKIIPVSLCAACLMLVAACETYTYMDVKSADADLARRILAENCLVGQYTSRRSAQPIKVREGIVRKGAINHWLIYKTRLSFETITVYSIKDLNKGWVEVDASGLGVRENFYFNRDTAEFACSASEWRAVLDDPMHERFEKTPLIATRMDRVN